VRLLARDGETAVFFLVLAHTWGLPPYGGVKPPQLFRRARVARSRESCATPLTGGIPIG
jgi:regulator of sirC expression with transglutaminase-like and TPR domain